LKSNRHIATSAAGFASVPGANHSTLAEPVAHNKIHWGRAAVVNLFPSRDANNLNPDPRTLTTLFGIALLASAAAMCGCHEQVMSQTTPAAKAASLPRVEVITPARKNLHRTIEQPAEVRPYEETALFARVPGYIRAVRVDIGDRIVGPRPEAANNKAAKQSGDKQIDPLGQVLIELSIPEVEDQVRQKAAFVVQSEANVKQARAAVEVAQAAVVTAEALVAETESMITAAEAEYQKRQSELQRFEVLVKQQAVAEKLVDESREHLGAAQADRQKARAQRESARAAVLQSKAALLKAQADVTAAEAQVGVAKAEHAQAAQTLAYGTLRAPFDGIVTRRNVHTGHLAQPAPQGEPLLMLMRTDLMRVVVDVPEADAPLVQPGDAVAVRFPAQPGASIAGKVTRTAGSLDRSTRTLRVEVHLPNPDGRLNPGVYAYASIATAEHPNTLVVPTSALGGDKLHSFCMCVIDGKVVSKDVAVGIRVKDEAEITAGLEGNEQVVRVLTTAPPVDTLVEAKAYAAAK
jgi:HlyD family secretion protein